MRIAHLTWESVEVVCADDPSKSRAFGKSRVAFCRQNGSLSIHEVDGDRPASALYTSPILLSLTSERACFEAFWWGARYAGNGAREDLPQVQVRVTCHF